MLDSFKAQLAFPTAAYSKAATTYDAISRGSSMNSAVYIINPADVLSAGIAGVDEFRHSVAQTRRSPGQSGSDRTQCLTQAVLLDVNGRPHVVSFNGTLTVTNHFVPPAGVTVDLNAVAKAVVACNIGYLLNPANSATAGTQDDVVEDFLLGVLP